MQNILHLKAPGNWINDPNGFIYFKGKYHLFYQHFPYRPVWGTMHWGHAVSEDLIHWEHLGIALYPSKSYDCNGVFSGSAIEAEGKLRLYYTAVEYMEEDPENIHVPTAAGCYQSQVMIESEDGFHFDNMNGKHQVLPRITDISVGDPKDCRDPKVWKENDTYYMCLASTHLQKEGVLLVFESKDGINWLLNSRVQDRSLGIILECPDMFEVDDRRILVASPIDILMDTEYPANQSICRFVEFDGEKKQLTIAQEYTFLDYGMELYAPQSNVDEAGRRVVFAWVRMPEAADPKDNTASNGLFWNGMMALPRVFSVKEDHIYTAVHPNVRKYFEEESSEEIKRENYTERICGVDHQILTCLSEGEDIEVYGVEISLREGCVHTDRSKRLKEGSSLHQKCKSPYVGEACELEIYAEPNLMEIFINDGQYVISNVLQCERRSYE